MKADDVARYLRENPTFFETHADLLAEISIPHPHGGRAIPLSDRQMLTLREKSRALESRLTELLQIGEENDAIGEKMHRLSLALLAAPDWQSLLAGLYLHLREDFAVPHAALRIWHAERGAPEGVDDTPEFRPVGEHLRRYAGSLAQPFCGPSGDAEAAAWFGEGASHIRSVAHMPLRDRECFGMLALGSEDVLRFYPEMGTLYLKRMGDLASAALLRFL
ncbi:MAG TPA: DUF484 family protein [Burkholderiales bacterium]|nr:DUF484 family protein [Burkholderiales bacterium]